MYISDKCNWTPYGTDPELDKKVDSYDWNVREAVAGQGYGLDKLINDKSDWVRAKVAEQGYGLDRLIYDKSDYVRVVVARQGYCLDKLINDESRSVREAIKSYLKEHNLTLEEWCKQHNIEYSSINTELKDFVYKIEDSSKIKVETSYDSVEEFFKDTSNESYEDKESITIVTVDTKIPIIKLEKTKLNDKNVFKFIATISIETEDISIKSIFETKEKFNQLVQSTITNLREYSQFAIYADELENCL